MSRVTLSTLNILKILTDLKADIAEFPPPKKKSSTKLNDTMMASKAFILSFKYSETPIPNIFKLISIEKM